MDSDYSDEGYGSTEEDASMAESDDDYFDNCTAAFSSRSKVCHGCMHVYVAVLLPQRPLVPQIFEHTIICRGL